MIVSVRRRAYRAGVPGKIPQCRCIRAKAAHYTRLLLLPALAVAYRVLQSVSTILLGYYGCSRVWEIPDLQKALQVLLISRTQRHVDLIEQDLGWVSRYERLVVQRLTPSQCSQHVPGECKMQHLLFGDG